MALVNVDKLVRDAVLSEDVRDINARLLLAKGLAISDQHIRVLKMWGVFEVHVQGADPEPDSGAVKADDERLSSVAHQVNTIFTPIDLDHPVVKEVVRLSITYRLERPQMDENETLAALMPGRTAKTDLSQAISAKFDRMQIQLPEVPSLIYELNEIIADPLSSAGDIGRVVSKSPSLAALLLKIVNSAFYGFRSKIDSISRAVTLIGSKEVSHLALGITIMETFRSIPRHVIDVSSFLEHNLACGIVSRIIAAHANIAHTEQMFVSGMLHDIGRLVLCKYFPQLALQTFATASREQCPLMKVEQELLGCTHAHLGKKLLHKWKLPYSLENNVAYHHHPSAAPYPECAATIQMADMIVHGLGVGMSGETMIPTFDVKAWSRVNLPVSAFPSIFNQSSHQLETFREVLRRG
jgi:HD-like signal output (HDOD) protein